ncbi:MAG TPA: CPBP family intramembrane glutamic endopeptidase [Polyangiaceae bacterium]|nr:CPBP family intramembrane glutamic endopeptidase [Polyangiaceae bacterium]
MQAGPERSERAALLAPSTAWTDLGLTLPVFVFYHLGVVFLPVRNAADLVTQNLVDLAQHSRLTYVALTLGLGALFVGVLLLLGRRQVFRWESFAWLALEGVLYAAAMRLIAASVVGRLFLGRGLAQGLATAPGSELTTGLAARVEQEFTGLVMSLGAGLYEEIAFRVLLFGLGLRCLRVLWPPRSWWRKVAQALGWAIACAALFSAWHHFGAFADSLDGRVFVFRMICGLVFTLIYATRGFAPAVWTHIVYDLWVLVF